jgi:hypothetical protein
MEEKLEDTPSPKEMEKLLRQFEKEQGIRGSRSLLPKQLPYLNPRRSRRPMYKDIYAVTDAVRKYSRREISFQAAAGVLSQNFIVRKDKHAYNSVR